MLQDQSCYQAAACPASLTQTAYTLRQALQRHAHAAMRMRARLQGVCSDSCHTLFFTQRHMSAWTEQ